MTLKRLDLRPDLGRLIREQLRRALQRRDLDGRIPRRLRSRGQIELDARIVRPKCREPLVRPNRGGVRALHLDRGIGRPRCRRVLPRLRDRIVGERLPERRVRRQRERGRRARVLLHDLCDVHVLLQILSLRAFERRELREPLRILRPERRVRGQCADRLLRTLLVLVRSREVVPGLRVGRILLRLLQRARDRRPARAALEEVVEEVAEARVVSGADAEEDEAAGEDDRQEDEDPLRLAPDPGEEEGLLGGAQLPATALGGAASIRLRALAALRRSSCHTNPPLSYRASPSTRVVMTRSGLPPRTTAAAGSSTGW